MQINPFGFPLGAGTQSAPATGGTGLGFADALGVAIEGGTAAQLVALKASPTPPQDLSPRLAAFLAQAKLAAQAEPQPVPATGTLPGLQQPTSLAELMATAAKLPVAEPTPAPATNANSILLPVPATATNTNPAAARIDTPPLAAVTETALPATLVAAPETAAATLTSDTAAPVAIKPAAVPAAPIQTDAETQPDDDVLPEAPATGALVETVPSKPQKPVRGRAAPAEAEPALTADASVTAAPAQLLAINAAPQPVAQQQVTSEASPNTQGGPTAVKAGKPAAAAAPQDPAQPASAAGTPDFARAVTAKTESGNADTSPDGQPQPEVLHAAVAKIDAGTPVLPQHAHNAAGVDAPRAPAAAAPAEPLIEARAGHLGQSLGVEIARKVELGEETLRIRLNPIELGRIEVTLAFDDKGSLQATVRTESAQAMDLLRQDAPDLARTLDQAGVRTDAQSFRFENRSGDGGGQQAQQQSQQSNRGRFAASDDALAAEPNYRPIRSDGQVDLLA